MDHTQKWPASVSTHLQQQELHQVLRRVNFTRQHLILLGLLPGHSTSKEEASPRQKTLLYVGQTLSSGKKLNPTQDTG